VVFSYWMPFESVIDCAVAKAAAAASVAKAPRYADLKAKRAAVTDTPTPEAVVAAVEAVFAEVTADAAAVVAIPASVTAIRALAFEAASTLVRLGDKTGVGVPSTIQVSSEPVGALGVPNTPA